MFQRNLLFFHLLSLVFLLADYLSHHMYENTVVSGTVFLAGLCYAVLIVLVEVFRSRHSAWGYLIPLGLILYLSAYNPSFGILMPLISILISAFSLKFELPFWCSFGFILLLPFVQAEQIVLFLFLGTTAFFIRFWFSGYWQMIGDLRTQMENLELVNRRLTARNQQLDRLDVEQEHLHRLEERHSISQKLHDQLGHRLSGSIYQLEAAQFILNEDPQKTEEMIHTCVNNLREGLEDLRQGVQLIRPDSWILKFQRLKEILARFEAENMIRVTAEFPDPDFRLRKLPVDIVLTNVQEGLTNILKHSKATEVLFSISVFSRLIRVQLKDNGVGGETIVSGMGLDGMEERMRSAGGSLVTDGSDGFSITMLFREDEDVH